MDVPERYMHDAFLEVINTAMHFEYASMPVGSANLPEIVATQMWKDVDDIILPRHCFQLIEKNQNQSDLCYLVGERGTGKSTALQYVLRKSDAQILLDSEPLTGSPAPTKTILHVNGNALLSTFTTKRDSQLLTRKLIDEINAKFMNGADSVLDLSERWRFFATRHAPDFANFMIMIREDYEFTLADYSDLKFVRDYSGDIRKEWDKAWRRFDRRTSEEKFPVFVDMMAELGHRLVIHLDNVDPLIDMDRDVALDAITSVVALAGSATYKVNVTIAVRREHFQRLQESLDYRQHQNVKTEPLIAHIDPNHVDRDIQEVHDIFLRRVHVLRSQKIREAIAKQHNGYGEVDLDSVNSYLAQVEQRASLVLRAFFFRHASSTGMPDVSLSPLFSSWHNGSIRGMARSIHALVEEYLRLDDVQAEQRVLELSDREARTLFFRHMLTFGVDETTSGGTLLMPHPSTTILIAREVDSSSGPQFFLPLRVLQYLRARDHTPQGLTVSISNLCKDFHSLLGVEPADIDRVIDELCTRSGYELGLIRIHRPWKSEPEVSLLPSGRALVDRLVKTCESLFWTACSNSAPRVAVARSLGFAPSELPRMYSDESIRASAAMVFVGEYLLPFLKMEHAYLDPARPYTDDDVKYLRRYNKAFGFERNNWFLSQLRNRITGFVHGAAAGVRLTEPALKAQAAIRATEARLNAISTGDLWQL